MSAVLLGLPIRQTCWAHARRLRSRHVWCSRCDPEGLCKSTSYCGRCCFVAPAAVRPSIYQLLSRGAVQLASRFRRRPSGPIVERLSANPPLWADMRTFFQWLRDAEAASKVIALDGDGEIRTAAMLSSSRAK